MPIRGLVVAREVVDCFEPFELPVGCTGKSLAAEKISFRGLNFSIAATEDGSTILFQLPRLLVGGTAWANLIFDAIVATLAKEDLQMIEATGVQFRHGGGFGVLAYFMTFDGNAYEALKRSASPSSEQS